MAVKTELTDSGRKKRKQMEPIDCADCLKDMTDTLNKPSLVTANNASSFFEDENKRRKKELSGTERV